MHGGSCYVRMRAAALCCSAASMRAQAAEGLCSLARTLTRPSGKRLRRGEGGAPDKPGGPDHGARQPVRGPDQVRRTGCSQHASSVWWL